jgi:hypothetical protein
MGLDMYLEKRNYVKRWEHIPDALQFHVTVERGGAPYTAIKPERVSYVIEQVAYWRKANQIHRWFVENVQHGEDNCEPYYCDHEKLRELLDKVNHVLAHRDEAEHELPTERGFFFGSSEYDEWYFEDLEYTREMLTELLAAPDANEADYYYRASW